MGPLLGLWSAALRQKISLYQSIFVLHFNMNSL